MRLDYRYLKEVFDENGNLKLEISFVDYIMAVISDSGKVHRITNAHNENDFRFVIEYDDLKEILNDIFKEG